MKSLKLIFVPLGILVHMQCICCISSFYQLFILLPSFLLHVFLISLLLSTNSPASIALLNCSFSSFSSCFFLGVSACFYLANTFGSVTWLRFVTPSGKIYAADADWGHILTFNPGDTIAVLVLQIDWGVIMDLVVIEDEALYVLFDCGRVYRYPFPPRLQLEKFSG